jgi:hypothetical protein
MITCEPLALQAPWHAFALGMPFKSLVNMHVMTQKFVLTFERSI